MLKPALRSACDPCRTKRVRCLRAPDSLTPCARCRCVGALCVTGAARRNGRPPKQRHHGTATLDGVASHATPSRDRHAFVLPAPPERQPEPYSWPTPGDSAAFFGSSFVGQMPALDNDFLFLADPMDNPYRLSVLCAGQGSSAAPSPHAGTSTALSTDVVDWLPDYSGSSLSPVVRPPPAASTTHALAAFCEAMEQRIAAADAFYGDPAAALKHCRGDRALDANDSNPAVLLLACSAELLAIVQRVAATADARGTGTGTETVLLALAAYLALLRLFDALFHRIHQTVCCTPPAVFRELTVKAVLRVGGGKDTLQDLPLSAYAHGVLGAIQGQMRAVERCLGIPAEHCLEADTMATASDGPAATGLFARADRAQLFWATMAQEDIRPQWGCTSYAASIRTSIQESMAILEGKTAGLSM